MKPTAPSLFFNIFAFAIYFPLLLFSDLLNQQYKNTFLQFIPILFCLAFDLSIYYNLFTSVCLSWAPYPKGIDNPFYTSVASICYLCAGSVYVVFLGPPTSSITLVSSLREVPTVAVLHHPFLFGEIPT